MSKGVHISAEIDVSEAADQLESAMRNFGTDEDKIIKVLGHNNLKTRQRIANAYKQSYGKDLISRLHSELSGNFRKAVLMSLKNRAYMNAEYLYKAISGLGTKESTIYKIIGPSNNEEISALKKAYKQLLENKGQNTLRRNLEKDLLDDLSGDFEKLIIAILNGNRDEGLDERLVQEDVELIYTSGEGKWGTDEGEFMKIFLTRSFQHIAEVDKAYQQKTQHGLIEAIEKELSGDLKAALILIVEFALDKCKAVASMLEKTMKGVGTDEDELIRLVLYYSEDNFDEIERRFQEKTGKPLSKWIADDISGDFKHYILAIVQSN